MSQKNGMQLIFLTALFSVLLYQTDGLPADATYSARSRTVDSESDGEWNQGPSMQDVENLKLIYGLKNIARPSRHADGLFTSGYSKLLGQLSAKDYLESLIAKRVSHDLMEDQGPMKRHSDAVFTDNYSRFRKEMAVKKYLDSVLSGKRSFTDLSMPEVSIRTEPSSEQTVDDISVDDLLNQLSLTL